MAAPPSVSTTPISLSSPTINTFAGSLTTVVSSGSTSQPSSTQDTQGAEPISTISGAAAGPPVSSAPASTLQPTVTNAAANSNSNAAQINQATLIGIIAGGGGFLLLVFILATVYLVRRRKRRRAQVAHPSSSEEEQIPQKQPPVSRGPSQDQPARRSAGEEHLYEAVGFGTGNSTLLPTPGYYHDKDPSSEATTPNVRNSVTLENETHEGELKEETPLDPFSSGYIPPPSPTPSEYVIVEHTADQPLPPRTSRDKRESRTSLLDTIVPEEGLNGFATLDSLASGRTSSNVGHRRTRSGDPSGSGTTTPPPKRPSNRLQKPRPSIDSTSSLFIRSTSPASLRNNLAPIAFPRDPFEASLEEESVGALRPSMERPQRSSISYEMREIDGQSSQRPSVSARPSLDTVGASTIDKASYSRKKSHIRSPSSPTRLLPNSPSFLNIGNKRGASSSVLSLQNVHEYERPNGPYMNSATMADASVYDFDIYRQPPEQKSHPPPASAARLSAALSADIYGSAAARKRFSASMSDLPSAGVVPDTASRWPASVSTNEVHLHGKEVTQERKGLEPTTNLYIPKESLDLPPS